MPFHSATENMAALLRSARLLKISPSGLLQITGTKRNGPPLGRLYSGCLGGRSTGVCSRQISPASGHASSRVWLYAMGCVRNYAVATEQVDEPNMVPQSKQRYESTLSMLDKSLKRTGRVTKTMLQGILHDIRREGLPSGNTALLLLRCCGPLLPELPYEKRTELAHHVWDVLQQLGTKYDVIHYNALLKVYLHNEFKFSPTDFLAKMETANVKPNRITYQRLVAAYCKNGDLEGASTILGLMKNEDLPITEAVFNSLVTGHARAGDMESSNNMLTVMSEAGIKPSPDTYIALLNAYAEKGDLDSLKKTMEAAESADCCLMDRDIMQVIFTLAMSGHEQHTPEIIKRLRHERGYIPAAINLCVNLITNGKEGTAFNVQKTLTLVHSESPQDGSFTIGNFFLKHCVNMDRPVEKIVSFCKELQESKMHTALSRTLFFALQANKKDMSFALMKMMKEQNFPIRTHYFWPLLAQHIKDQNTAGMVEVLKGMQELEVYPDIRTLIAYVHPLFPSAQEARQALKDAGLSLQRELSLAAEFRLTADPAQLYTIISDPSFTRLDFLVIRNSLIVGFRKFHDIESMVKITELLYKDERFMTPDLPFPCTEASVLLYKLIAAMPARDVQARQDKLREFFNQLQAKGVCITENHYKGMKNLLISYEVPELSKDVLVLTEQRGNKSGTQGRAAAGTEGKVLTLEKILASRMEENLSVSKILKQTIQTLCASGNLQRALELKQQNEKDMMVSTYAILISECTRQSNVEEALNLKREMNRLDSSKTLNSHLFINLVKMLAENGKVEEAVDMLKEMKEKQVALTAIDIKLLFYMFTDLAETDLDNVRRLQDTIFTLGLAEPTNNLCSPLVTSYLDREDLSGALDAVKECHKLYNVLPRVHDILVGLVKKGDTELLAEAMDFLGQERGEMILLYQLFFAFLQAGRFSEARKIIETPGLRARPRSLKWFAERCIALNMMETLEQMLEMTAKLFQSDRDEMYFYGLCLCKETNDWKKAEEMWMKMQEENVNPRQRTLRLLAEIFKNNGQEPPFEEPETWYKEPVVKTAAPEDLTDYNAHVLNLSRKDKVKEAFQTLKEANKRDAEIEPRTYDHLIRSMFAQGLLEDAMKVQEIATSQMPNFKMSEVANNMHIITFSKKGQVDGAMEKVRSMVQNDSRPSAFAISRLLTALADQANLEGIQELKLLAKEHESSMLFVNNTAIAHIKNGDLDAAVELLEECFTHPDRRPKDGISHVFKKVLEEGNDKALDKLSAMAERLANHFDCSKPATDLFLQLLDKDKVEDAKFMLARCNAVAEQTGPLMSFMARNAQTPGQLGKIKNLLSLIPDFTEKEVVYAYLMKCHDVNKDLESAKALYEQMQEEGVVAQELTLKRLAVLYRNAGQTVPFTEPPNSFSFYVEQMKEKAKAQETHEA
ncbi:leucine-rich PPR motif-containing protein, mitochondrial [Centropristis striata]|uniref:leucine-rich PPR motif-containing protein, mitochondrial n=1 Tax=Centropristis striata TaxID=184440 RepID=UPI0027E1C9A4|nr:leucine-rich PPR motif-containing protein, mitochondrial [Centropristis striata]